MALPYSFSNNTSPTGGQLDADLLALGAMGTTACSATGTNSIVLTQNANQPTVSVYVNNALFSFSGPNNSTGNVTVAVNGLSPLPLYIPAGTQATAGTITSGTFYIIVYLAALNSAAGGFQIVSAIPSANLVPIASASAVGLLVKNDGSTANTKIDITAQTAVLVNSSGSPIYVSAPSVVIDLTTVGANGMDTGARPTSGWVYTYLISTGSATAGLATATSPTVSGPTLPSGYSYSLYTGAMYCDSSQNLLRTRQSGKDTQYVITAATNTAAVPIVAHGTQTTYSTTSPTLAAVQIQGNGYFVPLTASVVLLSATNYYQAGSTSNVLVAPNTGWGGTNNGPEGSVGQVWPLWVNNLGVVNSQSAEMALESNSIAWCSSAAGGAIACYGWKDYYVKA